jgi:hypothetical protein
MIKYEKDPLDCRYASHEDIKVKLNGSWAYYKGEPVKISTGADFDDYKKISISSIRKGRWYHHSTISVNDPEFDQYNLRYGWFNSPEHSRAILSSRIPSRRYKQGIHNEVLSMVGYYGADGLTSVNFDIASIDAMMRAMYPVLDDAIVLLKDRGSVALSRDVALIKMGDEVRVFVGDDNVGRFHIEDGTVEIQKENIFSIIQNSLQEVGL